MKKLPILILALVIVGGSYFVYSNNKNKSDSSMMMDQTADAQSTDATVKEESMSGDIKTLIAKNIPMRCSFGENGEEYNAWIKGEMVKSEFSSLEGEGTVIIRDNCMYTWETNGEQGIKFCFDPTEVMEGEEVGDEDFSIWDEAENLPSEFSCIPAIIPDDTFDLPSGIEFMDFGASMEMEIEAMMEQ